MSEKIKTRPMVLILTDAERERLVRLDVDASLDKEFGKSVDKKRYDPWRYYSC